MNSIKLNEKINKYNYRNIYNIHKYNCSILNNYYANVEFFPHVIEIISCLATAYHD